MNEQLPLVTIGMPVRNGGALFRAALASVVAQDYRNLEIVVSDNASTDDTQDIVREFQARDARIRYIRQPSMLSAFKNFRYVLDEARGDFFCWAAHDDTRSVDFVSKMLPEFNDANVLLTFPDLFTRAAENEPLIGRDYYFDNGGLSPGARLRKQIMMQCFHIYGLWRTDALKQANWVYTSWWPDMPLMAELAYQGIFKHVPGPQFQYLEIIKSSEKRAQYQDGRSAASDIRNVLYLAVACYRSVRPGAGIILAITAFALILCKYTREAIIKYSGLRGLKARSLFSKG